MANIITLVSSVFAMPFATLGTTSISLGLIASGALVFSLAVSVFKRVKGR